MVLLGVPVQIMVPVPGMGDIDLPHLLFAVFVILLGLSVVIGFIMWMASMAVGVLGFFVLVLRIVLAPVVWLVKGVRWCVRLIRTRREDAEWLRGYSQGGMDKRAGRHCPAWDVETGRKPWWDGYREGQAAVEAVWPPDKE